MKYALLLSLTLADCTIQQQPQLDLSTPYNRYSDYVNRVNADNFEQTYALYFSPMLLNRETAKDPAAAEQLLFSRRMMNTKGHLERIKALQAA